MNEIDTGSGAGTEQVSSTSLIASDGGTTLLQQILEMGGPVVMTLIGLSLIALTIILFKSVELFLTNRRSRRTVDQALAFWQNNQKPEAINRLGTNKRGLSRVLNVAMRGRQAQQPDDLIREEVQRVLAEHRENLHGHLRTLDVIGAVSPLLGLFGTVLGMIEAFRQMEAAGSSVDPSVLSGGIWQALLTTGVGLAVAIPVVLAHQCLERRADALTHSAEDTVTRVFTADLRMHASEPATESVAGGVRAA